MSGGWRRPISLVTASTVLVLVLVGCSRSVVLPHFPGLPNCRGVGLDATLHGEPDADPAAWLIGNTTGERLEVTWPRGTVAVFDPQLRVVLADGTVFHREGDHIDGACGSDGVHFSLMPDM